MDLSGDIHAALYAALAGGSPPVAARVYDLGNVPTAPVFPYVVLGEYLATDASDKGGGSDSGHADDFAQTLHVWSRHNAGAASGPRGKKETEGIVAAIYAALHEAALPLAGSPAPGLVITCRVTFKQIFLDADGLTVHGVLRVEGYAHA